jgi:hypothetical protein
MTRCIGPDCALEALPDWPWCSAHLTERQVAQGAAAWLRARRVLDPRHDPAAAERGERIWRAERDVAGAKLLHRQALARVEREVAATDLDAGARLLEAIGEQDRTRAALDAAVRALAEAQQ